MAISARNAAALARIERKLNAIGPAAVKILGPIVEEQAQMMTTYARGLCAVPEIAQNVHVEPGKPKATSVSGVLATEGLSFRCIVKTTTSGPHVYNPRWEEFGTAPHSIQRRADRSRGKLQLVIQHPGAKARPFFWPAYRVVKVRFRRNVAKGFKAALKLAVQS